MLAFHSRVWNKAFLKGPLRTQVLTLHNTRLGKVRENPDFTKDREKKNLAELWQDPRNLFSWDIWHPEYSPAENLSSHLQEA